MADVKGDFQGLSLEDVEEEEVVKLEKPISSTGESLENYLVRTFLASNVNDQELYFGWDISLKVSFKRAVAPCNRWLREEGGGALGVEWRNFRGNTLVIGNMGARLENLNPNVLPMGYGQNRGLIRKNNMDLVITQDEPSTGLSSGDFDDIMEEDDPMVNGESLKRPRLHLANNEGNNNRNSDEYQNEISTGLAQHVSLE
ncbi:hypothetical protein ES332_A09G111300v1 [Gossypium tomentosum]|uniref:Uncharacterized protein n=1 Tax=Gossypium tomentosum TaxID=34277 RepID=A0A5D2P3W7_GOSTO|nr:hypothetical protein ES332_A09G111300v1 [Gossypium tomentosum]